MIFVHAPYNYSVQADNDRVDASVEESTVPNHADFSIVISRPPSSFYRDKKEQSVFVKKMYSVFKQYREKYNLNEMLSLLNRETRRGVDEEKKNKTRGTGLSDDEHKQIFWMRSQLTKNLRFPEIKS